MKRYDSYKDSGIEWIGEVPNHWEVRRIKSLSIVKRGASPRPIDDPKYFDENGTYAWVRIADVTDSERYLTKTTQSLSFLGSSFSVKREPGDFFISIAGSVGKPIITQIKCCIHDGFVWFPNLHLNAEYLYYIFKSGQPYLGLGKLGTQLNLNTETIGNICIPLPPEREISDIINYLDKRCGEIDKAIAKQQKRIELLQELRQSIITNAVTRGINPDAPLKDSGVEWIGQVPSHWEVCRLKNHSHIVLGKMLMSSPPKGKEHLYTLEKYLKAKNIGWLHITDDEDCIEEMWFNKYEKSIYRLQENDLVMNEGGDVGKIGIWRNHIYSCYIQNSINKITIDNTCNPFYFQYLLFAIAKTNYFWSIVNPISIAHLTKEKLACTPIVCPPLSEQQAIAAYLDKRCGEIDRAIAKQQKRIELLQELKQSIITEVVTGKRKVC